MFPRYIRDYAGMLCRFDEDVWAHITRRHPEMVVYASEIETTLRDPDYVRRSRKRRGTVLYYKRFEMLKIFQKVVQGWYTCVVVDAGEHEVKTAYLTERIKQGEALWTKD